MKILVTGGNGTVGSRLVQLLKKKGCEVTLWDRSKVAIDDYHQMEAFVSAVKPDIVYHLAVASTPTGKINESWLVNYEWASELAWITKILDIRFIFTSTVMVFSRPRSAALGHRSRGASAASKSKSGDCAPGLADW